MAYHLMETNTRVQLLKPFKNFMHSDLSDYRLKGLLLIYLRITRIDRRPWITALSIYVRLAVKLSIPTVTVQIAFKMPHRLSNLLLKEH
jgi:hypothetical protein